MVGLQVRGVIATGQDDLDTAIGELAVYETANGPVLVTVSGPDGGLSSWTIGSTGLAQLADTALYDLNLRPGGFAAVIGMESEGEVWIAGAAGIQAYDISSNGQIGSIRGLTGEGPDVMPVMASDGDVLITANPTGTGFFKFEVTGSGQVTDKITVNDTSNAHAAQISDLELVDVGGTTYAISASGTEMGISLWQVETGSVTHRASHGPSEGLGIMVPTAIQTATVAGKSYVLVASAAGGNGAISVLEIGTDGSLTPTDHVLDTLDTRFGQPQDMEVIEVDGRVFVVAAGGDLGIALLELLPDGRLLHHESLADSLTTTLFGVTDIAVARVGTTLQIFATSQSEPGLTQLSVTLPGSSDEVLLGTDTGERIDGFAGDDILIDGGGTDTLIGGSGQDIFVMSNDGVPDRIDNFDASQDRIDLSDWSFLYDTNQLTIQTLWNGTRIIWQDATLFLTGPNGAALDPDDVRDAITIPLNRQFYAPSETLSGNEGNDELSGTWGSDVLRGEGGTDTLSGEGGDDTLDGGTGRDVLNGGGGDDSIDAGDGDDEVFGGDGADSIDASTGNDTIEGGSGDDWIDGGSGNDEIYGGFGDDSLFGSSGNDWFVGGAGADLIHGGDGADVVSLDVSTASVTVVGGSANDLTIGSALGLDHYVDIETFVFSNATLTYSEVLELEDGGGSAPPPPDEPPDDDPQSNPGETIVGTKNEDNLSGGGGDDLLKGRQGSDVITGRDGDDVVFGGSGDDVIKGKEGDDLLYGGRGDDTLIGAEGDDLLFGGTGSNQLNGKQGSDQLYGGESRDILKGGPDSDVIYGYNGNDRIKVGTGDDLAYGDGGIDKMYGNRGVDTLFGGYGDDLLNGGRDDDILTGGKGSDYMKGGTGADVFIYNAGDGRDRMVDFNPDEDTLLFSSDLYKPWETLETFVDDHVFVSGSRVIVNFGNGNEIIIQNHTDIAEVSAAFDIA